jgi:hypothetical protein
MFLLAKKVVILQKTLLRYLFLKFLKTNKFKNKFSSKEKLILHLKIILLITLSRQTKKINFLRNNSLLLMAI